MIYNRLYIYIYIYIYIYNRLLSFGSSNVCLKKFIYTVFTSYRINVEEQSEALK